MRNDLFPPVALRAVKEIADVHDHDLTRIDLPGRSLRSARCAPRRTVGQGGAYVNNSRAEGIETHLTETDLASETVLVLRSGKKRYALLRFPKAGLKS